MKKRFIAEVLAGALAIGSVGDVRSSPLDKGGERGGSDGEAGDAVENVGVPLVGTHSETKEAGEETEEQIQFRTEHPIEAELMARGVSRKRVMEATRYAADFVKANRYHNEVQEKKYFAVCRDTDRWASIQKSIAFASEKTGVPQRVLIAIGLIESQFKDDAHRKDTDVHGAFQMTLATAKEAAKDANACFGFPIDVKQADDLKETKTAVRLTALRLRSLRQQYGQLGLAIMDYAGGRIRLEQKIKEAFPKVDLGEKDWTDMERHHSVERQAQKKRDALFKQMRNGKVTDRDRQDLKDMVRVFEAAGVAYTKAKQSWKQKRENLPKILADAGVSILALYEHEKAKRKEVPFSITYVLALDDIASRAEIHAKRHLKNVETEMNVSVVK